VRPGRVGVACVVAIARGKAWYVRQTMDDKRKLKGMLARIFSDATAEESERAELKAYLSSGALTMAEIKEVFADFVHTTWKITMADGVISDVERQRLNEIVRVLGLEVDTLPVEWVNTLRGSVAPRERH
jgi:tellurite resistance protein